MATIVIYCASNNEAKKVLSEVYKADNSATFSDNMDAVSGSLISAQKLDMCAIKIISNYYSEETLSEMFSPTME